MQLIQHAESDAWLSLGLSFYLNVLPLTRQLSELSGSLWAKALQVWKDSDDDSDVPSTLHPECKP